MCQFGLHLAIPSFTLTYCLLRLLAFSQVEYECYALISPFIERSYADKHWHPVAIFSVIFLLVWLNGPYGLQFGYSPFVIDPPFVPFANPHAWKHGAAMTIFS